MKITIRREEKFTETNLSVHAHGDARWSHLSEQTFTDLEILTAVYGKVCRQNEILSGVSGKRKSA